MLKATPHTLAGIFAFSLVPAFASAQDEYQARLDAAHDEYEQFISEKDFEGLVGMFAEDAVYQPATGGLLQGRDEIRQWHEDINFASMQIAPTHAEALSDDLVLDLGSFTGTLADAPAAGPVSGEYVVVVEMTGDDLQIRSLSAFPEREMKMPASN